MHAPPAFRSRSKVGEPGSSRSLDNGIGIASVELPLALQRHATSKLNAFEDLDGLQTLGFRGEALPSIAAVSALKVRSRQADAQQAASVQVDYGSVDAVHAESGSAGTIVQVRDLFENVPARRKFQRQPSTESGLIGRLVSAYGAAYPEIGFTLTIDGRRSFSTAGNGVLIEAATAVYGLDVGRAAIELMEPDIDAQVPGVTISGWLCAPTVTRSHRQQMIFFVNGRQIQSRTLMYALEEAYHTLAHGGPPSGNHGAYRARSRPGRCQCPPDQSRSEVRRRARGGTRDLPLGTRHADQDSAGRTSQDSDRELGADFLDLRALAASDHRASVIPATRADASLGDSRGI